jgi:uncharacterized caspase-like protein
VRRRFAILVALAAAIWLLPVADARADKRVALVVGMTAYEHAPRLTNAGNDAAAIAALFKKAQFDVVETRRDLTATDMRRAVRDFADKVRDADIAVVYYAGHGIEVGGMNYLIPTDARLLSDFDLEDETLSLDRVLKAIEPAKRLRLVILDACRENPFTKNMKRTLGTRSLSRGLAKIEPGSSDTLVAFAAMEGALADDGKGSNSPFTTALLQNLTLPGLDLRIALGRVRDDVLKATGNRQKPHVYGSLGGSTVALVPAVVDPNADARLDYEFAAQIGTKGAWESYLAVHKSGLYAELAKAARAKVLAAEEVSAKADAATRQAEEQAKRQAEEARRQSGEQTKRQLDEAKRQVEEAKIQAEEARRQIAEAKRQTAEEAQRQVLEAKRQAAEEAQRQVMEVKRQAAESLKRKADEQAKLPAEDQTKIVVASAPTQPELAPAAVSAIDPADVARLLQAHLKRVGCDPGAADGGWSEGSRRALDAFNKNAGTRLDVKLASLDALDAVRGKAVRVCPLACGKGQRAEGDRCLQITCENGFALGADGTCQRRQEARATPAASPEPRPAPVARPAPQAPAAASAATGGGKCFAFNGKRFCE